MKLKPKIIALDLDDTLLRADLTISNRTVEVLQKCMDQGVLVVLASGRAPHAMFRYAQRIGIDRVPSYIVANNGSQVLASDTKKTIFEHFLPVNVGIEAFRLTIDAGLSCHSYEETCIHVSRETQYSDRDYQLSGLKPIVPDDFEQIIRNGIYKLVIPGHPEFIVPIESEFKIIFKDRATVFVSKPYFMEILPLNAGKGEALKEIAESLLNIQQEDVMAFGDSMNDESLIRYAGMSVAMKNGRREIQKIARFITEETNDEDGIAEFIERMVL